MIGRQRFRVSDIQVSGRKVAGIQVFCQGVLVRGGAASDAVIPSPGLDLPQSLGIEEITRLCAIRQNVDHVIRFRERVGKVWRSDNAKTGVRLRSASIADYPN